MTGNRIAHPLLISLANLFMDFRLKASNHAFLLLALLPIPKFIHRDQKIRGVLESRLIHQALDFILQPLKEAARVGIMMADPLGNRRYCFTPLAAYIVDTPESALLACVAGKTSSVTVASYKEFGDDFRHEPRTAEVTLRSLKRLEAQFHPWKDIRKYVQEGLRQFRTNGVARPFWRDWPLSCPSRFLNVEPLHHWHKGFWDHDAKWCICTVGSAEIDFRFSVLHPQAGFRHFKEGISGLKQVTGREHRDVQRYIVPVIAGAAPKEFVIAIRSLMDFRYLAQSREIDEALCAAIEDALALFHKHKHAILAAGARRGKKNAPINNWFIPKLEFLQSVVPNIRDNGSAIQWSADATEHAHVTEIKNPARAGNNQDYETQICRTLDRIDKCRRFSLATAIQSANVDFRTPASAGSNRAANNVRGNAQQTAATTSNLLSSIKSATDLSFGKESRPLVDYFDRASQLKRGNIPNAPLPHRTIASANVAIHLTRDPSSKRLTIDEAAKIFALNDLRPALLDFVHRSSQDSTAAVGGRQIAQSGCSLPFSQLEVWGRFRLQSKAFHDPHEILPAVTVNVSSPASGWPLGRYDSVIYNVDRSRQWPASGMNGLLGLYHISPVIYLTLLLSRT